MAVVIVLLAQFRAGPQFVGHFHDDGIYVLTAKSLAEGRGYRVAHLPGEPPQTKYPPLYPAALAVLWKVWPEFPANVRLLEWVGVLGGAIAVAGGYLFLVRFDYAARPVAFLAAAAVATEPVFLGMCTRLMAEMPFAALVVAALWCVESRTHLRCVADRVITGVVIAMPALCRVPGVVLVPVALLVIWRAGRPVRGVALTSACVLAPWLIWVAWHGQQFGADPITGYYTDYLGWWADVGPAGLFRIAAVNVFSVSQAVATNSAEGIAAYTGLLANAPVALAGIGLIAPPGWLHDLRAGRLLAWFLAAYLGLIVLWPWPSARFVLPVQVFAAMHLLRPLSPVLTRPRFGVPVGLLVVGANLCLLVQARHADLSNPDRERTARLLEWVRMETSADAVIASPSDPMVALYADRKAFNPVIARPGPMFYHLPGDALPPADVVAARLRSFGAGYVVHFPVTAGDESEYFSRYTDLERAGVLVRAYTDPTDSRFAAYRVAAPP